MPENAAAAEGRTTINRLFQESARRHADSPALARKIEGRYQPITYGELAQSVSLFARGLAALGVERGDRVSMIAENRPEWAVADLGMLALGAVNVPLFVSLSPAQVRYAVTDSGAHTIIVSDNELLRKCLEATADLTDIRIVVMDPPDEMPQHCIPFADVLAMAGSSPLTEETYAERWADIGPDELASIIYTSGTTGDPKGVLLTHWNFASNVLCAQEVLRFSTDDVLLSFLPLNHVFERLAAYYLALSQGSLVAYSESIRRLRDNMRDVRPTMMLLVPRVYEVFQEGILDRMAKAPPLQRRLFEWALGTGRRRALSLSAGRAVPIVVGAQWALAERIVLRKLHAALGLDRLRFFVSGGAALPRATGEFFHSIGLVLLEGYGLTETSPVVSVNRPQRFKLGTIGPAAPGVEVRIGDAGEILVRGPNVMQGYHNRPEDTAAAFTADGWFRTGDIGTMDDDGYITVTDRLKDLLVLANGKNVAPQPIEGLLKGSPYISQAVVLGDRKPTVTALIVPAWDRLRDWAAHHGTQLPDDRSAIAANADVRKLMRGEISRLTADLAEYEKITRFALLDHEMTVEDGQLTPTLKVRRKVVVERYAKEIATMYRDAQA